MIKDGHISSMQLIAIMLIIIIGKGLDSAILILIHWGHSAPELLMLVGEIGIVTIVALQLPLFKDPNKNLIDLLIDTFGGVMGSLFGFSLFTSLLLDLAMNVYYDIEQIRVVFLPTTPPNLVLFLSIVAMIIPAYYGIEVLGRTNLIMFALMMVVILSLIAISFTLINIDYMPPLLGPGIPQLLKQGVLHSGFFGEYLVYLMLRPYVRSYRSFRNSFYIIAGISILFGAIGLVIIQLVFPYPIDDHLFFPFIELAKLIYFGRFIQHIEAVYAVTWLAVTFARLSLLLYVLSLMAASVARTPHFRRFAPSIGAMIYYGALLPPTLSDAIDFKDIMLEKRGFPFYGGIAILFLIVGYLKKWRNKPNGGQNPSAEQQAAPDAATVQP
ncbi:GerAB/ArcD/ProY family transporter [Sulfoacidibacillus thermotolerans]|uniref:Uncharacterized protein n=1 Tax=Sulfoacidibacillus thermotolerans TaxID=1765684 RepID=A0A2U3D6G6_SULT2|nr:GerAB/ArcD/ProY family transporter [Sulfoacidibacillus thermotolerans]PWI56870.1 hypothetical protein BM613_11585 [Sulfoacidibacillus thermotolerans]